MDKVALVTGAARGIGRATALKLAGEGYKLVVNDISFNDEAKAAYEGCPEVVFSEGDISDMDYAKDLCQEAKDLGDFHLLVNNAGITRDNLIIKMSEEDFDDVIQVNLKGTFNMMKAAARIMMKQRSGRIVNLSSIVGLHGNVGQVNYAASKAGVIGMTKSLAKELASRNVLVNAVAPGFIESDMTDKLPEEIKEKMMESIPLGAFGKVDDIGNLIVFLGSENSSYITGQVFSVDGGMSI